MALTVGEWLTGVEAVALLAVLALATLGTAALFLLGLAGYRRRGTRVYLLITVALALLVARSVVGVGTALGLVPMPAHHLLAHGFDVAIAALVLYAVYRRGPPQPTG